MTMSRNSRTKARSPLICLSLKYHWYERFCRLCQRTNMPTGGGRRFETCLREGAVTKIWLARAGRRDCIPVFRTILTAQGLVYAYAIPDPCLFSPRTYLHFTPIVASDHSKTSSCNVLLPELKPYLSSS